MGLKQNILRYIGEHLQMVTLSYVDGEQRTYSADRAVEICADPETSGLIIGAVCRDETLENLLDELIGSERADGKD